MCQPRVYLSFAAIYMGISFFIFLRNDPLGYICCKLRSLQGKFYRNVCTYDSHRVQVPVINAIFCTVAVDLLKLPSDFALALLFSILIQLALFHPIIFCLDRP